MASACILVVWKGLIKTVQTQLLYLLFCKDLKRYKEADEMFAECERQGVVPSQSTLFTRGTNYLAMNDTERAREFLGRAFEMNASDLSTRVNYGEGRESVCGTESVRLYRYSCASGSFSVNPQKTGPCSKRHMT